MEHNEHNLEHNEHNSSIILGLKKSIAGEGIYHKKHNKNKKKEIINKISITIMLLYTINNVQYNYFWAIPGIRQIYY